MGILPYNYFEPIDFVLNWLVYIIIIIIFIYYFVHTI